MTDSIPPEEVDTAVETAAEATPEKKPRRRRIAKTDPSQGAPDVLEGAAPAQQAAPGPQDRHATATGGEPAHGDEPAEGESAAGDASGPAAAEGGPGDPDGGNRRKRSRNRRRNRRSRDGAREAGEGGAPAPGVDDASPAAVASLPASDVNEVFADVISGAYDLSEAPPAAGSAEPGEALPSADAAEADDGGESSPELPAQPPQPPRRVLSPEPEAPKLQKVLAQSGVGSRRDLEQMIVEGRIAVNGQPAHVGQRVRQGDRITLDGKPVRLRVTPPAPRVIAYHKPVGEIVSHDDPQARPTVFRRLPRLPHGKWQSVGRLDINTEGLLLFTNSGDLANRLMHPRFGVEREYAVRVLGELSDEDRQTLLQGVEIDGQTAALRSIGLGEGEGVNRWYRVVITEGRNREVRRLFEAVGKAVSRLIRIRYGSIVLPRGLRRGLWVDLGTEDLRLLKELTGMPPQRAKGAREGRESDDDDRRQGRRGRRGRNRKRSEPGLEAPGAAPPRHADHEADENPDFAGPIPNPLQQTYDKRAFQQSRRTQREYSEDGPIPNPLLQTYDKRAAEAERRPKREYGEDGPIPNPLQQTYDKRFVQGQKPLGKAGASGGRRKSGGGRGKGPSGGQPDPMRTAVGYIGADAFVNKLRGGGGGGGQRPGGRRRNKGKGR